MQGDTNTFQTLTMKDSIGSGSGHFVILIISCALIYDRAFGNEVICALSLAPRHTATLLFRIRWLVQRLSACLLACDNRYLADH